VKNSTSTSNHYNLGGPKSIQQPTADDYESRQRELRIKYGSNKNKEKNYYSSRMMGGI
jgi:hypothetical protein